MKDSIRRRLEKTTERFEEVGGLLADADISNKLSPEMVRALLE